MVAGRPKKGKVRLDELLVRRGLAGSLEKARALLLAGRVKAPGLSGVLKPGQTLDEDQALELSEGAKYVSRGGEKLEGALKDLKVDPAGRLCLDVGASTGGFTDCLLRRGAEKVFAVDVGTGQLEWRLRNDPRVVSREQTHILKVGKGDLPFAPSLAVIDVSFISLEKVLPHVAGLLDAGAELLALVKPQFELPPKRVPGGVVRDPAAREEVIKRLCGLLSGWGLQKKGDSVSRLPGPEGNVEHFIHCSKCDVKNIANS